LVHFSRPRWTAWEWVCRFAGRSSNPTVVDCGPPLVNPAERSLGSLCPLSKGSDYPPLTLGGHPKVRIQCCLRGQFDPTQTHVKFKLLALPLSPQVPLAIFFPIVALQLHRLPSSATPQFAGQVRGVPECCVE